MWLYGLECFEWCNIRWQPTKLPTMELSAHSHAHGHPRTHVRTRTYHQNSSSYGAKNDLKCRICVSTCRIFIARPGCACVRMCAYVHNYVQACMGGCALTRTNVHLNIFDGRIYLGRGFGIANESEAICHCINRHHLPCVAPCA